MASTVQLGPLRFPELERHLELDLHVSSCAAQRNPSCLLTKANKLGVGTRTRGEALRADVQRLEQVRLPRPVRTDHEHETGLETEVEPGVRPNVPEGDRVDDH